ncbi:YrzI family small protein [Bacillus sp. T33-2]|nr:YrzI family small protein [Bacillus sp. T33-2]PLR93780.1 YrzI family protein [Bacillus sp. T33-2]
MTLNIFFFTVTIQKRELSIEETVHDEMVRKIHEENKDRQFTMYRPF